MTMMTPAYSETMRRLLRDSEDAIIDRVVAYGQQTGYTRYTSTLREAWRLSVAGLTASLDAALAHNGEIDELQPDEDYSQDPATQFGILEAQKHRTRGVNIAMFLGLLKYYRQGYLDVLAAACWSADALAWGMRYLQRFFDRVELGLASEWVRCSDEQTVSELQQTNRRLVTEKNKYLTLFESLATPCLFIDQHGRVDAYNHAAACVFNLAMIPGADYYHDMPRPEMPDWLREEIMVFTGAPEAKRVVQRRVSWCEQERVVEIHLAQMLDISGKFTGVTVILNDITAAQQAEEQLRDSEALFRGICASALDGIIMIDHEGKVCVWNHGAEQIFGLSSAKAMGQDLHALIVSPEYQERFRAQYGHFRECGAGPVLGKTLELVGRHAGGREIPVELSVSAFKREQGWHAIGIVRDISARKRVEQELQMIQRALEQTNRQLESAIVQANQMAVIAEAANTAKSQFLANMSHEIRTPMNGVIGMTSLLLQTELTQEQREYLDTIRGSADSLLMIINDILDFSKIEADRLELEQVDFNLRELLDDLQDIFAPRVEEKGLELTTFLPPQVPIHLQGDPVRLRQILTNLLGNALKFTTRGDVSIQVEVDDAAEAEVLLRFRVSDTGLGIPTEKLGLLFEAFSQLDASVTRKYGGIGLGLSISRRLAEMMGGRIGVESVLGQGSTFWFTARLSTQAAPVDETPPADLHGVRILGVDDHATNRRVLAGMLEGLGCRFTAAADGTTALYLLQQAAAEGDPYQVALLDYQMPDLDGERLGALILQQSALRGTRLVMLSSLGQRGEMTRLLANGFTAYLVKPVKHSVLHATLSRALAGQPAVPHPTPAATAVSDEAPPTPRSRALHILIAEDNLTNQKVAERMLAKLGYQADVVANGREAITAMDAVPYDLVLMDVQMPEMDGLEATRLIRTTEAAAGQRPVPIIALTANAMQGDREYCLAAGMTDYLAKPLKLNELAHMVERWGWQLELTPADAVEA